MTQSCICLVVWLCGTLFLLYLIIKALFYGIHFDMFENRLVCRNLGVRSVHGVVYLLRTAGLRDLLSPGVRRRNCCGERLLLSRGQLQRQPVLAPAGIWEWLVVDG